MDNSDRYIILISKYLSEQASIEEKLLLFDWIKKDKLNELQFDEIKKAMELSVEHFDPEIDAINLDKEWAKMELDIALPKAHTINPIVKKPTFSWMQIAAGITLLILIGSGLFYIFSPSKITLEANNSISENKLIDSSVIFLNSNSSISYNKNYNRSNRVVELQGEAFFNVHHDLSKPFIVKAGKLHVEAVGTSFYIKNKKEANNIEVFVETGKVKLYQDQNKSESVFLIAGESAIFDTRSLEIDKSNIQDINYLSWKTKIFSFNEATLENIINKLNQCYNSNIVILNKDLNKCIVTVSFNNQSLESVFKVLEATLDIQIVKNNNVFEIIGKGCVNEGKE